MQWKFFLLLFGCAAAVNSRDAYIQYRSQQLQQQQQLQQAQTQKQYAYQNNDYIQQQQVKQQLQQQEEERLQQQERQQRQLNSLADPKTTNTTVTATSQRWNSQHNVQSAATSSPIIFPQDSAEYTTATTTKTTTTTCSRVNIFNDHGSTQANSEHFSTKLFQLIGPTNPNVNVIYSPLSIQTLLAYIYMGAEGKTAQELYKSLEIPENKKSTASQFKHLLEEMQTSTTSPANDTTQLVMANKMYYNSNLSACENSFGQQFFQVTPEAINFAKSHVAAEKINKWISNVTQNRIENLIDAATLTSETQAILVNAIYFKAKWSQEFSTSDTETQRFYVNKQHTIPVDMMFNDDFYPYAEFFDLQAKIMAIPYLNSDMSMLIILPDDMNGLSAVEERLRDIDLTAIASKLKTESVIVRLPKFEIEFELDMLEPLRKLGIQQLFTDNAELSGFFESERVRISKVQHKAFINVNEAGSEAAASSYAKIVPLSLRPKQIDFLVDHPFMFAIIGPETVYFVGHVVKF